MKHLKLYEDIFDDWDEEEENPHVNIKDLRKYAITFDEDVEAVYIGKILLELGENLYNKNQVLDNVGNYRANNFQFDIEQKKWFRSRMKNIFTMTYEEFKKYSTKINENFDWDFDEEEEEPIEWKNLFDVLSVDGKLDITVNLKRIADKKMLIDPKSSYYDTYSNPKDIEGHITNIDFHHDLENHSVEVDWDNKETNVYRYKDLLIKI